jgi:hypothetical protein
MNLVINVARRRLWMASTVGWRTLTLVWRKELLQPLHVTIARAIYDSIVYQNRNGTSCGLCREHDREHPLALCVIAQSQDDIPGVSSFANT